MEKIGPDRVVPKGDDLVVFANRDMDDWRPAVNRRTIVIYQERRYAVTEKSRIGRHTWRYVLHPWVENPQEIPGRVIRYDPRYAVAHDVSAQAQRAEGAMFWLFWLVAPLLGFLPSRVKLELEARFGFDPIRLTVYSLVMEYLVLLAAGVWLAASLMAGGMLGAAGGGAVDLGLFNLSDPVLAVVVLAPDLLARTTRLLAGSLDQYGFYEWLIRLLLPRSRR